MVTYTMPSRMTWGGYEVEKQPCGSCATLDKGEGNELSHMNRSD